MDLLHHFNHNRCFGTVYLIYYMLANDFPRPKTELLIFFKQNSIYLFLVCLCSRVARLIWFEVLVLHEPLRQPAADTWTHQPGKLFQIDAPPKLDYQSVYWFLIRSMCQVWASSFSHEKMASWTLANQSENSENYQQYIQYHCIRQFYIFKCPIWWKFFDILTVSKCFAWVGWYHIILLLWGLPSPVLTGWTSLFAGRSVLNDLARTKRWRPGAGWQSH